MINLYLGIKSCKNVNTCTLTKNYVTIKLVFKTSKQKIFVKTIIQKLNITNITTTNLKINKMIKNKNINPIKRQTYLYYVE